MKAHLKTEQIVRRMEPDKVESWHWFSLKDLPESLFLPIKQLMAGISYGTLNFHETLFKEAISTE